MFFLGKGSFILLFLNMQKLIIISIITVFLGACTQMNSDSEKTITKGEDTVANMDVSVSKLDVVEELAAIDAPAEHKLLFRASGIEPGWFAEFYENKLRLVVNYGQDSVILNTEFKGIDDSKGFQFAEKSKNLTITFENKSCVNEGSGDKEDRKVTVELNKKTYKGCGSFVK